MLRAPELDESLAGAHTSLAEIKKTFENDPEGAEQYRYWGQVRVTEAAEPSDEQFGVHRPTELLEARRNAARRAIGEAIVRAVGDFSGLKHQADDLTLLIAKIARSQRG